MANINIPPLKYMPNLLHVLPAYVDKEAGIVNTIVEIVAGSINKYELITETGHLKLDRVGYSTLAFPATYGAIPSTYDLDDDPLDIMITAVTEPLIPGVVVEARVIGAIKFIDKGEIDDKIVAVLNDDKRVDHIKSIDDLGEYFKKEVTYYWEHCKDLKKPGTGKVEGFVDREAALKLIDESVQRYKVEYLPKVKDNL